MYEVFWDKNSFIVNDVFCLAMLKLTRMRISFFCKKIYFLFFWLFFFSLPGSQLLCSNAEWKSRLHPVFSIIGSGSKRTTSFPISRNYVESHGEHNRFVGNFRTAQQFGVHLVCSWYLSINNELPPFDFQFKGDNSAIAICH